MSEVLALKDGNETPGEFHISPIRARENGGLLSHISVRPLQNCVYMQGRISRFLLPFERRMNVAGKLLTVLFPPHSGSSAMLSNTSAIVRNMYVMTLARENLRRREHVSRGEKCHRSSIDNSRRQRWRPARLAKI